MKKIALIISSAFLIFGACKKKDENISVLCSNPTSEPVLANKLIVGSWRWVSEYVYDWDSSKYLTRTPANTGYTQKLIFQNDNNLYYYRNDSLKYQAQYYFTTLNTLTNQSADSVYKIIRITNPTTVHESPLYLICNDSLTINYLYYSDYYGLQKWTKN